LHHCTQPSISNFRFYDIKGANARNPGLLRQLNVDTHEFYLWQDPRNRGRALIFAGNASSTCATRGGSPSCPFAVWDISQIRQGKDPVALFMGGHGYSSGSLHSLTVSTTVLGRISPCSPVASRSSTCPTSRPAGPIRSLTRSLPTPPGPHGRGP